jgi:hypothetical protein
VLGAAAWLTVNVWMAPVWEPLRGTPAELAATEKETPPLPLPALPVTVIQDAGLAACQAQPIGAETLSEPPPAPLPSEAPVGDRVYVQGVGAWLTVTVWPAPMIYPLRARPVGFTSTV